jgi:hypothetical protein
MTAMIVGTALAILALCFVLYPLFREPLGMAPARASAGSVTGVTTAVDALREIEFDHVTGKLSDTDYAELKSSYTQSAVTAMRGDAADAATRTICAQCGPRPEPDAAFCSECGNALAA